MQKNKSRDKKESVEKIMTYLIIGVIIFGLFALFFTLKTMFFPEKPNNQVSTQATTQMPTMSRMSLTNYDKELARQMMDKNNDGKCDACGMSVEMCMDSGQIQCNMDSKSTIGVLGSQHIHADWKVYINGRTLDLSDKAHMDRMKAGLQVSSFIHVDSGSPPPEKTGDILHMHAKGVPLWIFFESIELKLPDGIKTYVNGKEISDYKNYVFNDLDKILITDGIGDLQQQLNSITDFSEDH